MSLSKEQWIKIGEVIGGDPKDIEKDIRFSFLQEVRKECKNHFNPKGIAACEDCLHENNCILTGLSDLPFEWKDSQITALIEKVPRRVL